MRWLGVAMEAMAVRGRDLDAFAYGDPGDLRIFDWGGGLHILCVSFQPQRRLLLEALAGYLLLRNGVPIGYGTISGLFRSAEIAFNLFEPHRSGDTAWIFARVLATAHQLFGAESFALPPYQVGGLGNDEGLDSGAWWFYRKLGFAPRDPAARRLMHAEEARIVRDPKHRTQRATLARLGEAGLQWPPDGAADGMGVLPLAEAGLAVTDFLAKRFGGDEDRGTAVCAREAAALLGGGSAKDWNSHERQAFQRWASLVLLLPGINRWQPVEKRGLLAIIRAKGGVRESDFVRQFDGHPRLPGALRKLVENRQPSTA